MTRNLTVKYTVEFTQHIIWPSDEQETELTAENLGCNLDPELSYSQGLIITKVSEDGETTQGAK